MHLAPFENAEKVLKTKTLNLALCCCVKRNFGTAENIWKTRMLNGALWR